MRLLERLQHDGDPGILIRRGGRGRQNRDLTSAARRLVARHLYQGVADALRVCLIYEDVVRAHGWAGVVAHDLDTCLAGGSQRWRDRVGIVGAEFGDSAVPVCDRIAIDAAMRAGVVGADIARQSAAAARPIAILARGDRPLRNVREPLGVDAARPAQPCNQQFRLVDPKLTNMFDDGDMYLLVVDFFPQDSEGDGQFIDMDQAEMGHA